MLLTFAKLLFQQIAFQLPDLVAGVFTCNLLADRWVEILGAGAGTLTGYSEAVAQHQDTEGKQLQLWGGLSRIALGCWSVYTCHAVSSGKVVLADDDAFNVLRGNAG